MWVLRERRKGLPIAGFAEEQDPVLAETLTVGTAYFFLAKVVY